MKLSDFHYTVSGKDHGPWVVFIHGLLGAAANWRRIIPAFETDYRVLAYDQRGHGRSFKPSSGFRPEDFADDLKYIMDSLAINKAHVIGHSVGGRNAFNFAYNHSDRVLKLVIEDIGPSPSKVTGNELVKKLRAVPVPFPDKRAAKEYFLNEFGNSKLGNFLYNSITVDAQGQAVWIFDFNMVVEIIEQGRGKDRWHEIEGLRVPTLVVRGSETDELSWDEYQRMITCNPLVKGVEISGAGHWVHFDKPKEFIAVVREFLKGPEVGKTE